MTEPIRVLLADDHAIVRDGLARILGDDASIKVVGVAEDGLQAITRAGELKPDIILMDIFMPNCSGLEATIAIRQRCPDIKILILTIYSIFIVTRDSYYFGVVFRDFFDSAGMIFFGYTNDTFNAS